MIRWRKRELMARALYWTGAAGAMNVLRGRDQLMVLNYHRIGDPGEDPFDPDLFSATAAELDDHLSYLRRHASLVTLDEALHYIDGGERSRAPRCRVLITFDDGYLDNYSAAFPVLRSHGAQAIFFLATSLVGTCRVPWWDRIGYLVNTARRRRFTLRYPVPAEINLGTNGGPRNPRPITELFYRAENSDHARFLAELQEACGGDPPREERRRFLSWEEAREMIAGGMVIGSHTHSHKTVSRLAPEEQIRELSVSRKVLREKLGAPIRTLAYPYGAASCISDRMGNFAREAGYRAAFSMEGGANLPGNIDPYRLTRICVSKNSIPRFRVQSAVCRLTGRYWP